MVGAIRRLGPAALPLVLFWGATAASAAGGYVGNEACAACHEEIVGAFGRTTHAVAPGWNSEKGCEACHGPGEEHAEGDLEAIRRLGELPPREASSTCLSCHDRQEKHLASDQGIHRLGEVGCNDCHLSHSTRPQLLERTGKALCADCHHAIVSQFDMPRTHPLPEGSEACARCHEPHASRALRTGTGLFDETCGSCHFEKMGPFLFSHDVVLVDGCASCHEVHGSPNRHLLRHETQVNLCYQCHGGALTPGWHSAPRFLTEKCTACHAAIHGSNTSPAFLEQ